MPASSIVDPSRPAARRRRRLAAGAAALGLVVLLGGCGGGGTTTSTAAATRPRGGPFAALRDPKVQACLKKHGVSVPRFGANRRRTAPPPGGTTTGRNGTSPPGARNGTNRRGSRGAGSAQFRKLRAALGTCGVKLPARPPGGNGAPNGPPPASTTAS